MQDEFLSTISVLTITSETFLATLSPKHAPQPLDIELFDRMSFVKQKISRIALELKFWLDACIEQGVQQGSLEKELELHVKTFIFDCRAMFLNYRSRDDVERIRLAENVLTFFKSEWNSLELKFVHKYSESTTHNISKHGLIFRIRRALTQSPMIQTWLNATFEQLQEKVFYHVIDTLYNTPIFSVAIIRS